MSNMDLYVSYDPAVGATYVKVAQGEVHRTVTISDLVMVDVDEHDMPLGVEFLTAPARIGDTMLAPLMERYPVFKALRDTDRWLASA